MIFNIIILLLLALPLNGQQRTGEMAWGPHIDANAPPYNLAHWPYPTGFL